MRPSRVALALAAAAAAAVAAAAVAGRGGGVVPAAAGPDRAAVPGPALAFRDVAADRGLAFRHAAGRFGAPLDPPAMMGGGACWLDADGDGRLDLFVVNGYVEAERDEWLAAGGLPTTRLFRNTGGRFEDVTAASGAGLAVRGQGCVAADLDVDGRTDLVVTTAETTKLLWNEGRGRFAEGAEAAGADAFGWHTGAAAGDLNGDGLPELVLAGYVDLNTRVPDAVSGFPNTHAGRRDLLYLNLGERRFREVGPTAGLEVAGFEYGLGALLSDLDRDGDLDLYLANDTNPNRLYENVPWPGGPAADPAGLGFRLEERAAAAGAADANAGMGVAAEDWDGDGRPDLFVTNARGQAHAALVANPPDGRAPSFTDAAAAFPAFGAHTGWGVSWGDLDLDADLDLVLANGRVPVADLAADAEPVQVLVQQGRRFRAAAPGGLPRLLARGSALADYDDDGDLDLAVVAVGGPLALLENRGTRGSWLEVRLDGLHPGAEATVVLPDGRRLRREARAGGSYLSSEDPRLHFGLGGARRVAELRVRWPDGAETRLTDLAANRLVVVEPPR